MSGINRAALHARQSLGTDDFVHAASADGLLSAALLILTIVKRALFALLVRDMRAQTNLHLEMFAIGFNFISFSYSPMPLRAGSFSQFYMHGENRESFPS